MRIRSMCTAWMLLRFTFIALLTLETIGCDDTVEEKQIARWPLECPESPLTYSGDATFYTFASGAGSCLYDSTPNDLMVAAMNVSDYDGSVVCGACILVSGPSGNVVVRVVDLCPECKPGDIDLSPSAFARIADTSAGRVRVSWTVIPCSPSGPIAYHFKEESNQWWTAVQMRNHRYPIYSLEYVTSDGAFRSIERATYNYFVASGGIGTTPAIFRVTDVFGHVLVDSGIVVMPDSTVPGRAQFPECGP